MAGMKCFNHKNRDCSCKAHSDVKECEHPCGNRIKVGSKNIQLDQANLPILRPKSHNMKRFILSAFLLLPIIAFNGCNSDDDEDVFGIDDVTGTYIGAMNVGSFENLQYTVTVTKITATSVKITPSTGAATEWTATLTKVLGVYTCIGCVTNSQITFTSLSNGVELAYNYSGNAEQYAGTKQ